MVSVLSGLSFARCLVLGLPLLRCFSLLCSLVCVCCLFVLSTAQAVQCEFIRRCRISSPRTSWVVSVLSSLSVARCLGLGLPLLRCFSLLCSLVFVCCLAVVLSAVVRVRGPSVAWFLCNFLLGCCLFCCVHYLSSVCVCLWCCSTERTLSARVLSWSPQGTRSPG